MEFVDVAYAYLAPFLLLVIVFGKGSLSKYAKSFLAAANASLLFFVVFACKSYYDLYCLAKAFGFNLSAASLLHLFSANLIYVCKSAALLILPFLFIAKKPSGNPFLSLLMVALVWWDPFAALFAKQGFSFLGGNYIPLLFPVLKYFSLLIGMYAMLWLAKRLPHQ